MTLKSTLKDTNDFLSSINKKNKNKPSSMDVIHHVLAAEYNITLDKIILLPIPYLMSLLKTYYYIKEQEDKSLKKKHKK